MSKAHVLLYCKKRVVLWFMQGGNVCGIGRPSSTADLPPSFIAYSLIHYIVLDDYLRHETRDESHIGRDPEKG